MKYCVTCKHFVNPRSMLGSMAPSGQAVCGRTVEYDKTESPVWGKIHTDVKFKTCESCRMDPEDCGLDGDYHESV